MGKIPEPTLWFDPYEKKRYIALVEDTEGYMDVVDCQNSIWNQMQDYLKKNPEIKTSALEWMITDVKNGGKKPLVCVRLKGEVLSLP